MRFAIAVAAASGNNCTTREEIVHVALIHNDNAGIGVYTDGDLAHLLSSHGHDVRVVDARDVLSGQPDVVVVSGGDGTVAKVAITMCGAPPPLFILPTGTSNNIARGLGIDATVPVLINGLARARRARLDIGRISGDGLDASFVEAAGVGFIGAMLEQERKTRVRTWRAIREWVAPHPDSWQRAANGIAQRVREHPPRYLSIVADGEDLSGEYVTVEVMNIPAIGPRVLLAPDADPGDGRLDLVLVRPSDREVLAGHIAARSATTLSIPKPLVRRVKRVEMEWPEATGHVDDSRWPKRKGARVERVVVELRGVTNLLLA
jgi:diacylglycerol kinase (ATP)